MTELIKRIIKKLPLRITKNQVYDYQTKEIIKKVCSTASNCIDVGCHKGEIMDLILKYSKNGTHYGFEPIPNLFRLLCKKYNGTHVKIFNIAMSNSNHKALFNHVISNPAYSGLLKRGYDNKAEIDEQIEVDTDLLDNLIPRELKIDLIKIDVEGGEFLVLMGAVETIKRNKPIIIFEHGLGASDYYGTTPNMVFDFFTACGLSVNTLAHFLKSKPSLTIEDFNTQFYKKLNYYFVGYPM